jgi:hypothetical protein
VRGIRRLGRVHAAGTDPAIGSDGRVEVATATRRSTGRRRRPMKRVEGVARTLDPDATLTD